MKAAPTYQRADNTNWHFCVNVFTLTCICSHWASQTSLGIPKDSVFCTLFFLPRKTTKWDIFPLNPTLSPVRTPFCLHRTEDNTWIMGMVQTIPTAAQCLFGPHALSDTGSSTGEKHLQVPHFKPHVTYTYSLQAELMWFCNTASRAPLTAAPTETAMLLTRMRLLRTCPEFYQLGKALLKIFSPCVPLMLILRGNVKSCSVLQTRIWAQEHSCLCAWTAKLLPKEQRKWIWWRYSAGQQYLWREGFNLDINQYIIAYVARLSSLLMI